MVCKGRKNLRSTLIHFTLWECSRRINAALDSQRLKRDFLVAMRIECKEHLKKFVQLQFMQLVSSAGQGLPFKGHDKSP